jgi:D-xylose 1-dehydrogenase (NADP+, D-xylono-1,5-lactone-forming)
LRWGILSTANITDALLGSGSDEEFVAVGSRDKARAEAWAAKRGVPRAYGSYEELLADPEIDAIYNPLPNGMHVEWSIKALEAGKHVLAEKPLTRNPAEVELAFDAADSAGRLLAEAFMWRHNPQVARVRELLDGGAIGELRVIRAVFSFLCSAPDDVRLDGELDGGGLMDVGCYCVSGLRTIAGAEPERVYAEQVAGGKDVDVAMSATLRFPGDVLAHFDCGLSYEGGDHLEAVGTEGSLFLDDPWHGKVPVIEIRGPDGDPELVELDSTSSYALELDDFAAAVRGEREPLLGRADALGQARAIAALYESAERNTPCRID